MVPINEMVMLTRAEGQQIVLDELDDIIELLGKCQKVDQNTVTKRLLLGQLHYLHSEGREILNVKTLGGRDGKTQYVLRVYRWYGAVGTVKADVEELIERRK